MQGGVVAAGEAMMTCPACASKDHGGHVLTVAYGQRVDAWLTSVVNVGTRDGVVAVGRPGEAAMMRHSIRPGALTPAEIGVGRTLLQLSPSEPLEVRWCHRGLYWYIETSDGRMVSHLGRWTRLTEGGLAVSQ